MKKIRENAGVSLAEVSNFTKVKQEHLQKIEEGDFDSLPPDVYIRGFIRSYANYLGLDPKEVLKYYDREIGVWNNIKKKQKPLAENKSFPDKFLGLFSGIVITPKLFTFLFFFLGIAGLFSYFYFEIEKFSENPRLVLFQPINEESVNKSSLEIAGVTESENKIRINGQPVQVNEKGEFKETLGLRKGINEIVVEAENKVGRVSKKNLNISADFELASVKGSQNERKQSEEETGEFEFSVEAKDDPVWILVEVDGKKKQNGTMLPDSVQTFKVSDQVRLTSGKANKTFIQINEKEKQKLAEHPGVERGVVFDKEGKVKENAEDDEKHLSEEDSEEKKKEDKEDKGEEG